MVNPVKSAARSYRKSQVRALEQRIYTLNVLLDGMDYTSLPYEYDEVETERRALSLQRDHLIGKLKESK